MRRREVATGAFGVAGILVALLVGGGAVAGRSSTPLGRWVTIDDHLGRARSIVRIDRDGEGRLVGRLEELLLESDRARGLYCKACRGTLHDRPLVGLKILWGLRRGGGSEWVDGHVLDPDTGKIYHCYVRLKDDGRLLEVRAYVGFRVFGRTQVWKRAGDR